MIQLAFFDDNRAGWQIFDPRGTEVQPVSIFPTYLFGNEPYFEQVAQNGDSYTSRGVTLPNWQERSIFGVQCDLRIYDTNPLDFGQIGAQNIGSPKQVLFPAEVVEVQVDGKNTAMLTLSDEVGWRRDENVVLRCRIPQLDAYSYAYFALCLQLAEKISIARYSEVARGFAGSGIVTTYAYAVELADKSVKIPMSKFGGFRDLTFNLKIAHYDIYSD